MTRFARIAGPALLIAAGLLAACGSAPTAAPAPSASAEPVHVKVLAINDFHGNLKPAPGGIRIADPADAQRRINVPAGGVSAMATLLDSLRAQNSNNIFVAAGDLIGASPLLSSLLRDEPTIEAMNLMGLEASAMGNHELDRGQAELLRLQNGGCHPTEGCKGPAPFTGAKFQYLAANTIVQATGKTLLPSYVVKKFQGIPIPSNVRVFTNPSPYIEINNQKIRALNKEVMDSVGETASDWEKIEKIYDAVLEKIEYVEGPDKGAVEALTDKQADCQGRSAVFIAVCRANKIPARMVWVNGHCYPEFYLEHAEGAGHWYPCESAGSRAFGEMPLCRTILQKGDNFRVPERKEKLRYASDFLIGLPTPGGGKPKVKYIRETVAQDAAGTAGQ